MIRLGLLQLIYLFMFFFFLGEDAPRPPDKRVLTAFAAYCKGYLAEKDKPSERILMA